MIIKHICFDLDGTLVRSDRTIYRATVETLNKLKIFSELDEVRFKEMIGMHFIDMFKEFDVKVNDFNKFISIYKSLYFDFINESELYEGVEEVLNYLGNFDGIKVSLLTTKGQDQAEKIIKHFKFENHFDFIMGRRDGIAHKPSAEPLIFICNQIGANVKNSMIVGDTELDIVCGKNAGAITCGVSYGYRNREDLVRNKPDFLLDEIIGIKSLLNN